MLRLVILFLLSWIFCLEFPRCPRQNKQMSHRDKSMDGEQLHETERNKDRTTSVLKNCELSVRLQFGSTEILPTECKGDS